MNQNALELLNYCFTGFRKIFQIFFNSNNFSLFTVVFFAPVLVLFTVLIYRIIKNVIS